MRECNAVGENVGAWRPTLDDVIGAARATGAGACLKGKHMAEALAACARRTGTTTVEISLDVPRFTACQPKVRSLEWNGRRWVKISVFMGEGATFFGMDFILELQGGRFLSYYEGDQNAAEACTGRASEWKTPSAMRADFMVFPKHVKDFFCLP
jgi:hypothetical protein